MDLPDDAWSKLNPPTTATVVSRRQWLLITAVSVIMLAIFAYGMWVL